MRRTILLAVLMSIVALPATAADCDHSKPLDATLQVDGARSIEIVAEAGSLTIDGRDGADQVIVEGRACASSEKRLGGIELVTRREGDRLVVVAKIDDNDSGWRNYARLDLTISVPADLPLEVDDGSGETRIRNVAALDLVDGSGGIDVADVAANVRIRDGSGEIDLERVGGEVDIDDGSGSLSLRDIGSLSSLVDGSGEIDIAGVRGDVRIRDDGSGGIDIRDVTGSVLIGSDGSGSIRVTSVGGDLTVQSDGSGTISVDDVKGTVRTP
jgi:DUF4097 and DUF4098 domain-containing protein YvlB